MSSFRVKLNIEIQWYIQQIHHFLLISDELKEKFALIIYLLKNIFLWFEDQATTAHIHFK